MADDQHQFCRVGCFMFTDVYHVIMFAVAVLLFFDVATSQGLSSLATFPSMSLDVVGFSVTIGTLPGESGCVVDVSNQQSLDNIEPTSCRLKVNFECKKPQDVPVRLKSQGWI